MMLHHFPHQAIDGSWHAVRRITGCNSLHSIGEAFCKSGAQAICTEANKRQSAIQTHDREEHRYRVPAGFYTNEDAA